MAHGIRWRIALLGLGLAVVAGGLPAGLPAARAAEAAPAALGGAGDAVKELIGGASDAALDRLGKSGGFWNDPLARIALPGPLKKADKLLKYTDKVGLTDGLKRSLNTAAERATAVAKPVFRKAIDDMSWQDAAGILTGGDGAATQYFRDSAGDTLRGKMRPLVDKALRDAGATRQFAKVTKSLPLPLGMTDADLTNYVTDKATDGIFQAMAAEEKALRADPVKAGKALLKALTNQ